MLNFRNNNIGSWLSMFLAFALVAAAINKINAHEDTQGGFIGGLILFAMTIAYKIAKYRRYNKSEYSNLLITIEVLILACVGYLFFGTNSDWLKRTIANDPVPIFIIPVISLGFYLFVCFWPKNTSIQHESLPNKKFNQKARVSKRNTKNISDFHVDQVEMTNAVLNDDQIYEIIANEIESGDIDKGVWTRLLVQAEGDENKTKILYIKEMFRIMKGNA